MAYQSDESGQNEIYMQAFPEPRGKWQISNRVGQMPEWRPDGRELYFLTPESKLMAVGLQLGGDTIQQSAPRELFAMPVNSTVNQAYVLAPDGKRFLVRAAGHRQSEPLEVIPNWPALLKPGGR